MDKLRDLKLLVNNAPEGASHIEEGSGLFIKVTENDDLPFFNAWWIYEDGSWVENDSYNILLMRKLNDIRENIALQERVAELETVLFDLLSLSSFHMSFPFEAERLEKLTGKEE